MSGRNKPGSPGPFKVRRTIIGEEDYRRLRPDIRSLVDEAERKLERLGCAGADYRLVGEDDSLDHICVVHLARDWRLVIGFRTTTDIATLLIGRHIRGPLSVYARLYRLLGIDPPPGERDKPPCCGDDGEPPVDDELVERIVATGRQLRRG